MELTLKELLVVNEAAGKALLAMGATLREGVQEHYGIRKSHQLTCWFAGELLKWGPKSGWRVT